METTNSTRHRIVRATLWAPANRMSTSGGATTYTSDREDIARLLAAGWRLQRIAFLPADRDRLAALIAAKRAELAASGERDRAGSVSRRNGAWLIAVNGELSEYATPDEQYDCASSLRLAKKLAVEIAATFGYLPPFHWLNSRQGLHEMIATKPDEEVDEEG